MSVSSPQTRTESPNEIINPGVLCPSCRYCLKGLSYRGVCPECGLAYEAADPDIPVAVGCFTSTVPKHRRLWLTPDEERLDFPLGSFLVILAAYAGLSGLFVAAGVLTSTVGYHLPGAAPEGDRFGWNAFVQSVPWDRADLRIHGGAFTVGFIAFWGQFLIGAVIWARYALAARRARAMRWVLRRLGVFAMASVPSLLVVPMAAVAAWQVVNVSVHMRLGYGSVAMILRLVFPPAFRPDLVQLPAIALIVIPGAIIGLSLYRMHRRAIIQVRNTLNGVVARPVGTDRQPTPVDRERLRSTPSR